MATVTRPKRNSKVVTTFGRRLERVKYIPVTQPDAHAYSVELVIPAGPQPRTLLAKPAKYRGVRFIVLDMPYWYALKALEKHNRAAIARGWKTWAVMRFNREMISAERLAKRLSVESKYDREQKRHSPSLGVFVTPSCIRWDSEGNELPPRCRLAVELRTSESVAISEVRKSLDRKTIIRSLKKALAEIE